MLEFDVRPGVSFGGAFPRCQHCELSKSRHASTALTIFVVNAMALWVMMATERGEQSRDCEREGKNGELVTVMY